MWRFGEQFRANGDFEHNRSRLEFFCHPSFCRLAFAIPVACTIYFIGRLYKYISLAKSRKLYPSSSTNLGKGLPPLRIEFMNTWSFDYSNRSFKSSGLLHGAMGESNSPTLEMLLLRYVPDSGSRKTWTHFPGASTIQYSTIPASAYKLAFSIRSACKLLSATSIASFTSFAVG
jgi:hypothetical protein